METYLEQMRIYSQVLMISQEPKNNLNRKSNMILSKLLILPRKNSQSNYSMISLEWKKAREETELYLKLLMPLVGKSGKVKKTKIRQKRMPFQFYLLNSIQRQLKIPKKQMKKTRRINSKLMNNLQAKTMMKLTVVLKLTHLRSPIMKLKTIRCEMMVRESKWRSLLAIKVQMKKMKRVFMVLMHKNNN